MRKLLLLPLLTIAFLAPLISNAQKKDNGEGNKTYYDAGKTKLKEVFMTKQYVSADPENPGPPVVIYRRYGPYFYYYENGKVKVSGEFKDDEKSGTWSYYDEKGTLTKTEKYVDGKIEIPDPNAGKADKVEEKKSEK